MGISAYAEQACQRLGLKGVHVESVSQRQGAEVSSASGPRLSLEKVRPAYEQVAEQLQQQILGGRLRAGDRLPSEGDLLSILGVSRSTLREALRVLAARDLVHTRRGVNGGTFVSEVNGSMVTSYLETSLGLMSGNDALSVEEIVEAREAIEIPAASLAARRALPEQIETLRAASKLKTEVSMKDSRFEGHRTFHSLLVQASGNRFLAMMNEPIFRVLRTRFRRTEMSQAWWAAVDADHVVIAEHIAHHREEEAADLMRSHLEKLRALYLPISNGEGEETP